MKTKKRKVSLSYVISVIFISIVLTFFMIPIFVMGFNSLRPTGELMQLSFNFTTNFSFNNYMSVFENPIFFPAIRNSFIVSTLVTFLTLICGSTAAYSFTRFRVFGSRQLSTSVLIMRMVPPVVMGIPLYIFGLNTQLLDTYFILILAVTTFALPFQVWMLLGFYSQIPRSLDESARIDGCSYLSTFIRIITPSAAPGLAATAILTFIFSWNELFFALVLSGTSTRTAPLFVRDFMGFDEFNWGAILASGVVLMIPTLLVGIVFKRYMVSGLTAGAVKE